MDKIKMRNRPRRKRVLGMDGVYHLLSRTSCCQYLFGEEEKEMFARLVSIEILPAARDRPIGIWQYSAEAWICPATRIEEGWPHSPQNPQRR